MGALTKPGGPLDAIAKAYGATQAQVALAWLLARTPNMVAIPGTSSMAHLEENVGAAQLRLTADQIAELTALAA
jgi:pyridoxine 4-dehydrogenase